MFLLFSPFLGRARIAHRNDELVTTVGHPLGDHYVGRSYTINTN